MAHDAGIDTSAALGGDGVRRRDFINIAAVFGKILGGAAGARMGGFGWSDALAVGALMNARALM